MYLEEKEIFRFEIVYKSIMVNFVGEKKVISFFEEKEHLYLLFISYCHQNVFSDFSFYIESTGSNASFG